MVRQATGPQILKTPRESGKAIEKSSAVQKQTKALYESLKQLGAIPTPKFEAIIDQIESFDIDPKELYEYFDPVNNDKSPTEMIENWRNLSSGKTESAQERTESRIRFFVFAKLNQIRFKDWFIDEGEIFDISTKC